MKCADSQFFLSLEPDMRPTRSLECQAGPGDFHNHEVPRRESVEYATIRWGCRLRVIQHHSEETSMQSVKVVLSSWPHKLPVSVRSIQDRLSDTLQRYRRRAETNDYRVEIFLSQHGQDRFDIFRRFVLQYHPYWSAPIPVPPEGNYFNFRFKLFQ